MLLSSLSCFSQERKLMHQKKEELKAVKVAFITEALDLTPSEAQKFWPVYNEFENAQFQIRERKMETSLKKMSPENLKEMSDKDATTLLEQIENTEGELFQLRKKLVSDLRSVVSAKKILLLKKAEEDFNRKLLQQYKRKRK